MISFMWITVVCNNPQSRAIKKLGKPDYKGNDSESFPLYLFDCLIDLFNGYIVAGFYKFLLFSAAYDA